MIVVANDRNRYPGAQPFSDDEISRKVFFGRQKASRVLADKILANHMVTVYARSGLGKTSLLQAGVAPRLREEGFLPLFVRLNDTRIGPLRTVLDTIPGEARRQHVEYVPGSAESLWSFFKTAEFWRDDLLLTPVLILDQFEELFTLQSERARAEFLNEVSYLTRGVRPPPGDQTLPGAELSGHPPAVTIVLSLREDYLGYLEEAAEHIPQILDARFRLAPLDLDAAREAIVGPAAVTDPGLVSRPFTLDDTTVTEILDYLALARMHHAGETRLYVEPFQLQLICRRMEQIADSRAQQPGTDSITMADLGGEAGLTQTLRDFYREAIESLPDRRNRRASRHLCEEYLISPEGRRLSLEENELNRQLGLQPTTLGDLVSSRLLRSESRSESVYYELSHDALVEPILESRRTRAHVLGILGTGSGAVVFLLSLMTFLAFVIGMAGMWQDATQTGDLVLWLVLACIGTLGLLGIIVSSVTVLRTSARSMLRHRLARETPVPGAGGRVRAGLVGGLTALVGGAMVAVFGLVIFSISAMIVFGPVSELARLAARALKQAAYLEHRNAHGVGLDTLVYLVAASAMLAAGARLCRWGIYRLAGVRRGHAPTPGRGWMPGLYAFSRTLAGGIAVLSALLLAGMAVLKVQCGTAPAGPMPEWLDEWFNFLPVDCTAGYPNGALGQLVRDAVLFTILLVVAIPMLRRGIRATRRMSGRPCDAAASGRDPLTGGGPQRGGATGADAREGHLVEH